MKKYTLLFLLLFGFGLAEAQTMDINSPQIIDLQLRMLSGDAMSEGTKEPVDGSVYLDDNYGEAFIITERGEFNPQKMRYNLYEDAMEFEMGGKTLMMDASPLVKSITIGDMVFVAADYPYKTKAVRGFLEQIQTGKYALYAKKNISYRSPEPPRALEATGRPAKYVRSSDSYFFKRPGQNLIKVANIKEIIALQSEHEAVLKKYVKKMKLNNKNVDDMAKFISYLNSL